LSIPSDVVFDRYSVLSGGFLSVDSNLPLIIGINGVCLVTALVAAGVFGPWSACNDPVTTSWTPVGVNSTSWSAIPTYSTVWTISPYGV
jgi:hypothetical protein